MTLKDILHIDNATVDDNSPLGQWYKEVINKSLEDITIGDYSRMLRQNVLLHIAVPNTLSILFDNPFEGEMYDGEMLELLIRVTKANKGLVTQKNLQELLMVAKKEIDRYEWESERDKEEYILLLKELATLADN